jgi:hypothetical protein
MAGFIPGASPPEVKTPIVFIVVGRALGGSSTEWILA